MNTNSYAVDQGRYGASQVNYFTKSGSNQFHGDAYEIWNGSLFNATDYFLHANDTPGNIARKPRSTVNEFGVSVGGPILQRQALFLRPLRRHPHRAPADCPNHCAFARFSAICVAAIAAGRPRSDQRNDAAGAAPGSSVLSARCSGSTATRQARQRRFSLARWTRAEVLLPGTQSCKQPVQRLRVARTNAPSR